MFSAGIDVRIWRYKVNPRTERVNINSRIQQMNKQGMLNRLADVADVGSTLNQLCVSVLFLLKQRWFNVGQRNRRWTNINQHCVNVLCFLWQKFVQNETSIWLVAVWFRFSFVSGILMEPFGELLWTRPNLAPRKSPVIMCQACVINP